MLPPGPALRVYGFILRISHHAHVQCLGVPGQERVNAKETHFLLQGLQAQEQEIGR